MGKKSAPPPPDYTAAAEKQGQASQELNTQQTYANRANEITPWGNLTWETGTAVDPTSGDDVTTWTQRQTLDPRLQSSLNAQLEVQDARSQQSKDLIGRMQSEFAAPMDWGSLTPTQQAAQAGQLGATTSAYGFGPRQQNIDTSRQGVPQLQTGLNFGGVQGVDDATTTRARAEDAIYKSASSRLDPQWDRRAESFETDLANRGISRNSEAYTRAQGDFDRSRNDAYAQAQMAAITGGGAEAQRDFGMDLGLRQQQVGEIGQQGEFTNESLGQMFGFGDTARGSQLEAQGQIYQQGLLGDQANMQRQQQAFSQQQQAGAQNFAQQQQSAGFNNTLRQQQLSEEMQKRGFSLNEINALLTGQQVQAPQFGGYNTAGVAQAPDYMGALGGEYGASMDASNAKQAGQAQTTQGIAGIATIAAIAF